MVNLKKFLKKALTDCGQVEVFGTTSLSLAMILSLSLSPDLQEATHFFPSSKSGTKQPSPFTCQSHSVPPSVQSSPDSLDRQTTSPISIPITPTTPFYNTPTETTLSSFQTASKEQQITDQVVQ